MDDFDKIMDAMAKMGPDEVKAKLEDIRPSCDCISCPSYGQCAKDMDELLFCFEGKSGCIKVDKGCLCPSCPVTMDYDLKRQLYCLRGSERELRINHA
jgi:hypothetical protein